MLPVHLFFTVIGLLSIAANVQAACTAGSCGSNNYCSNAGTNGVCKAKKKGGEKADKAWMCFTNFLKGSVCGCTTQTGNKGCITDYYCDSSKKCQKKKGLLEECSKDYECENDNCDDPFAEIGAPPFCVPN